jgi:uncharacterized protein YjgD (DUF1641 family)
MEMSDVMQKLSKPENAEALDEILEALPVLRKSVMLLQQLENMGALDTLFSLACAIANSKNMLSDEMVAGAASLASNAIELLSKMSTPEIQKILSAILDHSVEIEDQIKKEKVKGILGLMGELRDPEVQKGLSAVFAILRVFGRHIDV